ncbi:MAG: protein kinase [Microcoleaceae cyanobacterium]
MKILCTRPSCPRPENSFTDLDDRTTLKTVQQKFCTTCGMPLILDGRYLPERLLGQGGFGAAFLAKDRRSPTLRSCVVKQFQPAGDLSPQQLAVAQNLFEREALVLDRLGNQHPQIPNLLAYFPLQTQAWHSSQSQQFFYLVQEYIDGQDLEAELSKKGPFPEAQVREVLEAILKILQFVHDQEVIHRDIKPSNIMRHRNGQLYLLDFGAVKQITQATSSGKSTGIYSMGFAPPEQMRGQSVFPSTDLYALAVTCIMLLTGKDPQDLYDSYSNEWHWRQSIQVSDELATVLDRMLMPTPSDRFGSAEQVLWALSSSSPSTARPPSTPSSGLGTPRVQAQPPHQSTSTPLAAPPPTAVQHSPVKPPPSAPPSQPLATRRRFSTLELISNAAFTGFETGLVGLALLLRGVNSMPVLGVIGLVVAGGLGFSLFQRWIEKWDLLILVGISLGLALLLVNQLRSPLLVVPVFMALIAALGMIIFRLIYLVLKRLQS